MVCRNCYAEVALNTRLVELLETFYNESNLSNKTFYNESNLSKLRMFYAQLCSMWQHGGGTNVTVTIHTILGDYTKLYGILM